MGRAPRTQAMVADDSTPLSRWLTALLTAGALVVPLGMVAWLLWGIWRWGSSVPFDDEWIWAVIVQHLQHGGIQWQDFWATHNDHRIVIPLTIDMVLIELTHWNRRMMMTFNVGVVLLTGALLIWSVALTVRSRISTLVLVAPLSLLLFTWGLYEGWFQPFHLVAYLNVFGAACCVRALAGRVVGWERWLVWRHAESGPRVDTEAGGGRALSWRAFALAVCGAVLASFSFATGLMLWIAFLPSLLGAGRRKLLLWLASAVAVWIVYFATPDDPTRFDAVTGVNSLIPIGQNLSIVNLLTYVLAYLGDPLGYPDFARCVAFGALGVALLFVNVAVLVWLRQRVATYLVWVELALWVGLAAASTAYGRLSLGLQEAIQPRYQVWSVLWWVALCVLGAMALSAAGPSLWRKRQGLAERVVTRLVWLVQVGVGVVCVIALVGVNLTGVRYAQLFVLPQQRYEQCVIDGQTAPPVCARTYNLGDKTHFDGLVALLASEREAIFYEVATGRYVPHPATLPLVRYYNPALGAHWATTVINNLNAMAPAGYQPEVQLGYVYIAQEPNTRPLFACNPGPDGRQTLAIDATCAGRGVADTEGWILVAPPLGVATTPLYRCAHGPDHFVSLRADCEGYHLDALLGYALVAPA